jgi:hypothetical protein
MSVVFTAADASSSSPPSVGPMSAGKISANPNHTAPAATCV